MVEIGKNKKNSEPMLNQFAAPNHRLSRESPHNCSSCHTSPPSFSALSSSTSSTFDRCIPHNGYNPFEHSSEHQQISPLLPLGHSRILAGLSESETKRDNKSHSGQEPLQATRIRSGYQGRDVAKGYHQDMVFGCGWNYYGQLGIDDQKTRFTPSLLPLSQCLYNDELIANKDHGLHLQACESKYQGGKFECERRTDFKGKEPHRPQVMELESEKCVKKHEIRSVVCGGFHGCVLMNSGMVYSCGHGAIGQLGHKEREHERSFKLIKSLWNEKHHIKRVALGGFHSLFLTESGRVFSCGQCSEGQAGFDRATPITEPTEIDYFSIKGIRVRYISCGWSCSFAIDDKGIIYCWGGNDHNQLGIEETTSVKEPVILGKERFISSNAHTTPHNLDIIRIISSEVHTAFIDSSGLLFVCGLNDKLQLGISTPPNGAQHENYLTRSCAIHTIKQPTLVPCLSAFKICQAALTRNTSTFLSVEGDVYYCGMEAEAFTILNGASSSRVIGKRTTHEGDDFQNLVSLKQDEIPVVSRISHYQDINPVKLKIAAPQGERIVKITSGLKHTMLLTNSGRVYGFGVPSLGRLGVGMQHSFVDKPTEVIVHKPCECETFGNKILSVSKERVAECVMSDHETSGAYHFQKAMSQHHRHHSHYVKIENFSAGSSFSLFLCGRTPPSSPVEALLREDYDFYCKLDRSMTKMRETMLFKCRKQKKFLDIEIHFHHNRSYHH